MKKQKNSNQENKSKAVVYKAQKEFLGNYNDEGKLVYHTKKKSS